MKCEHDWRIYGDVSGGWVICLMCTELMSDEGLNDHYRFARAAVEFGLSLQGRSDTHWSVKWPEFMEALSDYRGEA